MARINTNIASIIAQSNLAKSGADLQTRLQRLSTGLRINKGADDPAGLIISERLRSEMRGIGQAIKNSERASSVIATTEGYLNEVTELLNSIKALVVESANTGGLSQEEIEANQLQVDSAIESITRISNTASFAGLQLLNGSLEYQTSGLAASAIANSSIHSVQFGNNPSREVEVAVITSAQTAELFLSGSTGGVGTAGTLMSSITLEVAGNDGVQTLSFISGTSFTDVVAAVNSLKDSTGVEAELATADPADGLFFRSIGYGQDAFASVKRVGEGGDFFYVSTGPDDTIVQRDEGRDVLATINGALATGNGLEISMNSPGLSLDLLLTDDFATLEGETTTFNITGGGADFQLGPQVNATQQVGFGIGSVAASRLGGSMIEDTMYFLDSIKSGQANSLISGNAQNASRILEQAITQTSVMRGRLGAFERNTIQTNVNSLQIGLENITASESIIRDADFAKETALLARAQILQQAGTSVLATANVASQNVLSLLG